VSYSAELIVRFLVTAFFAVVFLQSAIDKSLDRNGNLAYFGDHFKASPFPPEMVPLLLTAITVLEALAGGLCALGVVSGSWARGGFGVAGLGVAVSGFALLGLIVGQRLAKDYAGAAVVAAYFAVALIGLTAF
jgi:putative oxidoreductase